MKKVILMLSLLIGSMSAAFSQKSMEAIFDRYADDERFTYVSVGKGAFNLVKSFAAFAEMTGEERAIVSKMNGVKILTLETERNQSTMKNILSDVDKLIKAGKHESIAEVRDKGERTQVYVAKDKSEMIIINKDKSELSLIWLLGSL